MLASAPVGCAYGSPIGPGLQVDCRFEVFSETGLPRLGFLGNPEGMNRPGLLDAPQRLAADNCDVTWCKADEVSNPSHHGAFVVARFCRRNDNLR